MQAVLGIDLGTQGLKAIVYDFHNREVVESASAELALRQNLPGQAEQEAAWWLAALASALSRISQQSKKSVVAIGVSGQQHGFVALDKNNQVLSPVKLWCDTSTEAYCEKIMSSVGGAQACIETAGNPILAGYTASKIRWLKEQKPELFSQMYSVLLPHDYLNLILTGERSMEAGDASGTGLLNVYQRQWSEDVIAAVDDSGVLAAALPDIREQDGRAGFLRPEIANKFGLPEAVPVSVGGGDNMMGAIGTGNVSAGQITMSLGTSGTVYAYSDKPVVDPGGEIAAFCSSTGGWLPLLCTMNCTLSTELTRAVLGADIDSFEGAIANAPAGAGGVITLPFFMGERTPNLPNAKASITGLDPQNYRRGNLLRSAVEGATFGLKYGLERLRELGVDAQQIALTGGGSSSATWRQIVADICALPIIVHQQNQGAALGAALQALSVFEGCGIEETCQLHLQANPSKSCEPNSSTSSFYQQQYEKYQARISALSSIEY